MDYWIKVNQLFLWLIARTYLIITFSNTNVQFKSTSLNKQHGYVIASNHQSNLDPFMILGALPLNILMKLAPVKSMSHRNLFEHLPVRVMLRSFGGFPTKEIKGLNYGLPFSFETLIDHGTIAIFPEGTRVKPGEKVEAKRGVAELASQPDTEVILCHLIWNKGKIKRVQITISAPKNFSGQTAQMILDHIYAVA